MKLVLCVDDRGGMLFNKRRQSRDRVLIADLCETIGDAVLYINQYSEELFAAHSMNMIVCESPLSLAGEGDYAFIEKESPRGSLDSVEELILYKWNRKYPYDLEMGFSPEKEGFSLKESSEFVGSSHEKITKEIYAK